MAITSEQVWRHYVPTAVVQRPFDLYEWVVTNWLTEINDPAAPKIWQWDVRVSAYGSPGSVTITNAVSPNSLTPATIQFTGGFNVGDTIQVNGEVDDGGAITPFTVDILNTLVQDSASMGSEVSGGLEGVANVLSNNPVATNLYDHEIEVRFDGITGPLTLTSVVYAPAGASIPTPEAVP